MTQLVVIGLDGGTNNVMDLPDAPVSNIRALRAAGASGVLRSTLPPITSAAWPSMFTGWNPGRHGMYGFRVTDPRRYTPLWGPASVHTYQQGEEFVDSHRWAGHAFWDLAGRRVGVLSVPMTYPPWPVQGVMAAGFPLPDYRVNHTAPADAAERLPLLLDRGFMARSDEALARSCAEMLERQCQTVLEWAKDDSYDVIVAVFQATDFAQHRLWKYLERPQHPLRRALLGLYGRIDTLVGDVREAVGEGATIAVLSDHGFGPHPKRIVRTDAALLQSRLIATRDGGAARRQSIPARVLRRLPAVVRAKLRDQIGHLPAPVGARFAGAYTGAAAVGWSTTQAYRSPMYPPLEGVMVNLQGRQLEGAVAEQDYEAVRSSIISCLEELSDGGERIFEWARRREELYHGEFTDRAPDVVALCRAPYKASSGFGAVVEDVPASILERYSGVHERDGIFAIAGPDIAAGVDLGTRDITDVAPTLLGVLGVAPPDDLDGAAMTDVFSSIPAAAPSAKPAARPVSSAPYSAEEEAAMLESLRALGYVE